MLPLLSPYPLSAASTIYGTGKAANLPSCSGKAVVQKQWEGVARQISSKAVRADIMKVMGGRGQDHVFSNGIGLQNEAWFPTLQYSPPYFGPAK